MALSRSSDDQRRTNLVRVGTWSCVMLGLLWALSPIVHGVLHLSMVAHRHAPGSAHQHHAGFHGGDAHHGHSREVSDQAGHHHHGHRHSAHDSSDSSEEKEADRNPNTSSSDDSAPHPNLPSGDAPLFLTLEVQSDNVVAFDVPLLEQPSSFVEVCFEETEAFQAIFLGPSGPRGPPV